MLTDKGFELGTDKAQKSRLIAGRLLEWIEANDKAAADFSSSLLKKIRECCTHPRAVTCHTFKERMWEKYYKMCSSVEFRSKWNELLETSIGFLGCPIFYQFVTQVILEKVIKAQFPVDSVPGNKESTITSSSLDFEEANALQYCGGYLLRSLKKKIGKSAHPLKEKLLLCIQDLLEGICTPFCSLKLCY